MRQLLRQPDEENRYNWLILTIAWFVSPMSIRYNGCYNLNSHAPNPRIRNKKWEFRNEPYSILISVFYFNRAIRLLEQVCSVLHPQSLWRQTPNASLS